MYFKIRGGEAAIEASHGLLDAKCRGNPDVPELAVDQISEQMGLAVDRVMMEGSLYDRKLAALAIKQAQGDLVEAAFLVRAARATLERFGASEPVDPARMIVQRRISTTFKDIPGGQILGPTYDYTHRLIDFELLLPAGPIEEPAAGTVPPNAEADLGRDLASLIGSDLLELEIDSSDAGSSGEPPGNDSASPSARGGRLQDLARGDEGFLLGLAYSSMRGYGDNDALAGEIRFGELVVEMTIPELGIAVGIGMIALTECQTLHPFPGNRERPPQFTRGYGLVFGQLERKAISMAIIDRALRAAEFCEAPEHPVQDADFVLAHADNVNASGLVQVLKLPHYVHFQGHVQLLQELRAKFASRAREELGDEDR